MKLVTKEVMEALPGIGSQESLGEDAIAHVKFFCPWSNWTWYASEAAAVLDNGTETSLHEALATKAKIEDVLFFGVVAGHEREYGYFSLRELESVRGMGGLKIERDIYWRPRPLREC